LLGKMAEIGILVLESCIEHGKPTLFADDTTIFITGNSIDSVQSKVEETVNRKQ
jgi:hypothetical protein